jgi:hypothetical protein
MNRRPCLLSMQAIGHEERMKLTEMSVSYRIALHRVRLLRAPIHDIIEWRICVD